MMMLVTSVGIIPYKISHAVLCAFEAALKSGTFSSLSPLICLVS